MEHVGHVESLWRYPVKSMRGEELREIYLGAGGISGDRRFAFHSSAAPRSAPYLTSRAQEQMLLYRPFYREQEQSGQRQMGDAGLDVETPWGETLAIDDGRLPGLLTQGLRQAQTLSLVRSDSAMADEFPVSLFSIQTARQLAGELGLAVDKRRFRANIYVDLHAPDGFREDSFVGRRLRVGDQALLEIVKRDPRCKIITLDPDTGEANGEIIRHVATAHERCAGVYATVTEEGTIRRGDAVTLAD